MATFHDRHSSVTGTITTQNLNAAGAATAGSAVEIDTVTRSLAAIQVTGTYTGALTVQATVDGLTWVTVGGSPVLNVNSRAAAATIASATQGIFQVDCAAFTKLRVTALAAVTGTATVTINASSDACVNGNQPATVLGSGASTIGLVSASTSTSTAGLGAPSRIASAAATTNATLVKASAGRLYKVRGYNAAASVRYIKFYNKATAPTVGTDAVVFGFALAPNAPFDLDFGMLGESFATGIGFGITTGAADNDTGALTAGDVTQLSVWYA